MHYRLRSGRRGFESLLGSNESGSVMAARLKTALSSLVRHKPRRWLSGWRGIPFLRGTMDIYGVIIHKEDGVAYPALWNDQGQLLRMGVEPVDLDPSGNWYDLDTYTRLDSNYIAELLNDLYGADAVDMALSVADFEEWCCYPLPSGST